MAILIDILSDPAFLSLLMASRVHQDMLMMFFKLLTTRTPSLFAHIRVLHNVSWERGAYRCITLTYVTD